MGNSFFRGTDAELYTGGANFSTLITATPTAYGLVAAQATAFAGLNTGYAAAYVAATNPETRTSGKIAAKNVARLLLKRMASNLAKVIDGTPTVTHEQLIALGLNVRAAPVPIPAPGAVPLIQVKSVSGVTASIRIIDPANPTRRGKPPGVAGIAIFSHVGAAAPTELSGWKFEGNTGRTVVNIVFPSTLAAGTKVWLTAFYFNPRKQSGVACDPVSTNLPGGGVSTLAA